MDIGKTYDELKVGDKASFSKTVTEFDIYSFAGITGDLNPVHVNEEYAKRTKFGTRVAHGGLTIGFIAPVLGMILPGPGTIVTNMSVDFLAPVKPGDTVTAAAEVIEKVEGKNRVRMKLTWTIQTGAEVCRGEATVVPPRK